MVVEIWKFNPVTSEQEFFLEIIEEEDYAFKEGEPGSTYATKLIGVVMADETSPEVTSHWKKVQADQNLLEETGLTLESGQTIHPIFVER